MGETMFLYLTLGTNDLARAKRFYDAALAPLGLALRTVDSDELGYGRLDAARTQLWITKPYDGNAANNGNGTMVAFDAPNRAAVDAFYSAGLRHGGTDEGAPGLRPYGDHFYACYLRDPDGNKLSAVCETPE
jgi:catechol 2,3-dioxygenase-like lactoylglutathione lyase family enzyme